MMDQACNFPLPVIPISHSNTRNTDETLWCALESGDLQSFQAALANSGEDFDINQKVDGVTLLCKAVEHGHGEICDFLLQQKNIDVNKTNSKRETPLLVAVQQTHLEIARLLLKKGADVDKPSVDGSKEQDEELAVIHSCSGYGLAPIHQATYANCVDIVQLLIQFGCNVNNQQSKGYTPLFLAARLNCVPVAKVSTCSLTDFNSILSYRTYITHK